MVNPTVKARANHLADGESASVSLAAKGEAATVPSAAVGETTAGVAVEAAGAAILAWSMGPKPNTERGGEEIPGQAARTVEPQASAITVEPQAAAISEAQGLRSRQPAQ